jgi:hypothetical protein
MHKSATKCNETIGKWCKNKHGASKIIDMFETYQVAHQGWYGGSAIPGGPVAEVSTAVLDAGAYGGSLDRSMADPKTGPWRITDDRPMAGPEIGPWRDAL